MTEPVARPPGTAVHYPFIFGTIAVSVWVFGFATLGAIVAPIVFRTVPAPWAADAMTLVFARFDKVALVAGTIAIVAELLRLRETGRIAVARRVCLGIAFTGLLAGALVFTPTIARLHREGAIRHIGPAGEELEQNHRRAEAVAKAEVYLGFAYILLQLVLRSGASPGGAKATIARREEAPNNGA